MDKYILVLEPDSADGITGELLRSELGDDQIITCHTYKEAQQEIGKYGSEIVAAVMHPRTWLTVDEQPDRDSFGHDAEGVRAYIETLSSIKDEFQTEEGERFQEIMAELISANPVVEIYPVGLGPSTDLRRLERYGMITTTPKVANVKAMISTQTGGLPEDNPICELGNELYENHFAGS